MSSATLSNTAIKQPNKLVLGFRYLRRNPKFDLWVAYFTFPSHFSLFTAC